MKGSASRGHRQVNLEVVSNDPAMDQQQSSNVSTEGSENIHETAEPTAKSDTAANLDKLLGAAIALPNIDGRSSVFSDAPIGLDHSDREEYAVAEEPVGIDAHWGRPSDQEFVMVSDDPARSRLIVCLKEKRGRNIYPVSPAILEKYPRLRSMARTYMVRQAVTPEIYGGETYMWGVPWIGPKEAPSDQSHRNAHKRAMVEWVRTEWDGRKFQTYRALNPENLGKPNWTDKSFNDLLMSAVGELTIQDEQHEFLIRVLGL